MTDRDALRDALEAFYRAAQGSCDYPLCPSQHEGYAFDCVEAAKQRVEEVAAALAGSGPEAGLRAAVQRYIESPTSANWQSVERLAATPTASPTDGLREGEASATQSLLSNQPLRGGHRVRAHSTGEDSTLREVYLAATRTASPTATEKRTDTYAHSDEWGRHR